MDAVALEHGKISHIGIPESRLRAQHEHQFDDPNYGREHGRPNGKPWLTEPEPEPEPEPESGPEPEP